MTEPINDDQLEDRLRGYLHRFTTFPRASAGSLDAVHPGSGRGRNRLGLIAAVAAVALCVTGTATAALVVTLNRGNGSVGTGGAIGSTTASSGHSMFIPFAGPGGGTSSGQASSGSTAPAPAGLGRQAQPGAGLSAAAGNGAIFPGNYGCGGAGGTQVANGQIQAQGIATVGSAGQATAQQLTIEVSGGGATNKAAVTDAQARQVAVNIALQQAGITTAALTVEPVQIGQNGYFYYNPGQPSKPSAAGIIYVSSTDPVVLGTAADAAQKAGGSQVSTYGSYGTQFSTPSSSDLATALRDATNNAHDEAAAAASASGLHLGKVSGLTSSPPSLCYGAGGEGLVVTVTINYSLSS